LKKSLGLSQILGFDILNTSFQQASFGGGNT